MVKQAKFTYSFVSKRFEKQIKITEDQGEKQITKLEVHEKQLFKCSGKTASLKFLKQK